MKRSAQVLGTNIPIVVPGRARRRGGATNRFSPLQLGNLAAWYDFSNPGSLFTNTSRTLHVVNDGDLIAGVTDLSGTGKHLSQGTGSLLPTYRTGALNGLAAARFVSDDRLDSSTFTDMPQPNTVFLVGKQTTAPAFNTVFNSGSVTSSHAIYRKDTDETWAFYAGTEITTGKVVDTNFHVFGAVFNGASSKMWVDGGAGTTGNPGANSLGVTLSLGDRPIGGQGITGDIAEFLLFDGDLTVAEVDRVGSYLARRWALVWATAS